MKSTQILLKSLGLVDNIVTASINLIILSCQEDIIEGKEKECREALEAILNSIFSQIAAEPEIAEVVTSQLEEKEINLLAEMCESTAYVKFQKLLPELQRKLTDRFEEASRTEFEGLEIEMLNSIKPYLKNP